MTNAIKCYLVKPSGRSKFWKMRFQLPGDVKETQRSLKVRDERTAQRKMSDFIIAKEREAAGIIPSSKEREKTNAKIEPLLCAHLKDLQTQNCDPEHVKTRRYLIERIVRESGWTTVRDITSATFGSWRNTIQNLAPRTVNNYLAELKAFLNWLVDNEYLPENPLSKVPPVKAHHKARERRALTDEQIAALLTVASADNRMIYLVALHTGLRRKEMRLLEWQDVFLDEAEPFIRLRAATTKNRKGGEVSIHPELADELKRLRGGSAFPTQRVLKMFQGLGPLKKDLAAAGISFEERGLRFDLHAARKTFNTRMAKKGFPTRVAMHAMRHSEERLTTVDYTDASRLNVGALVATLPPLLPAALVSVRASGNSASDGNRSPQSATMRPPTLESEHTQIQSFSHTLTQQNTLCLIWGKSSLTRIRT